MVAHTGPAIQRRLCYPLLAMIEPYVLFMEKAQESLAGAESEAANGRHNNCANRCYYATTRVSRLRLRP